MDVSRHFGIQPESRTGLRAGGLALSALLVAGSATGDAAATVLTTIAVDGDLSDWDLVLADPRQWSEEGPSGGLPDGDAPVPTTGRDLEAFAWTYDVTHLFFYVRRAGSASNRQRFWFYVDTDENGLLEAGEPVVGVSWWGASGSTETTLYAYVPASPSGDPLGDPSGIADGWTMPGSVSLAGTLETGRGGSSSGLEMESRVAWSDLGVAPGTPVLFHVSASASANLPSQIHDNMGGPGGRVGTTRTPGVFLAPDRSGTAVPGGSAVFAHVLTNTGTHEDAFAFSWTSIGDFDPVSVSVHLDVAGDGILDPGDPVLGDTDGNGLPDTGPVAANASVSLLAVALTPPAAIDGSSAAVLLVAASESSPATTDSVRDDLTIATPVVTLVKSVSSATAAPGDEVVYTIVYTTAGSADAHAIFIEDAVPPETEFVPGSATGPGTVITYSHDGGSNFDGSDAAPVTHVRWSRTPALAPGSTGTVAFHARVR